MFDLRRASPGASNGLSVTVCSMHTTTQTIFTCFHTPPTRRNCFDSVDNFETDQTDSIAGPDLALAGGRPGAQP